MKIIHSLECPKPGELLFVRALARPSAEFLVKNEFDVSCDQKKKSVDRMLKQLNLEHLEDREFVSIYAFTTETWKHFRRQVSGMSEALELAIVLSPPKLIEAGEVWLFNGDIQNLADRPRNTWWCRKYTDVTEDIAKELDSLVPSRNHCPVQKMCGLVPEARLYARLTPNLIDCVYCRRPNDTLAMQWADKVAKLCESVA